MALNNGLPDNRNTMIVKWAKISSYRLKKIVQCFCEDLTATQAAHLLGLNRNTVNRYYRIFRERIAGYQEKNANIPATVEIDEHILNGLSIDASRKDNNKVPAFGIVKKDGKVFTQLIRNASKAHLIEIIEKINKGEITADFNNKLLAFDGIVLYGYRQFNINNPLKKCSGENIANHDGAENFWGYTKKRLLKFNGISSDEFYLHLKECEFRYNEKGKVPETLVAILK